ncbi:MAG: hypothetical protein K8U57_10385 [Planctomycetes bacterium]|nr:hypothetical protein [Planctomycetota bacterium]
MNDNKPINFPPAVAELLAKLPVAPLGPGTPDESVRAELTALNDASFGSHIIDRDLANCCRSGLWLAFNFLDESHRISQDYEESTGNFWHAIMHRREPDPSNSKYWWRRVGVHPVFDQLRERAASVGYAFTTPEAFVDFCEKVRDAGNADEELAKRVQATEWRLLFEWCWRNAIAV